jgi:hypothetical protein
MACYPLNKRSETVLVPTSSGNTEEHIRRIYDLYLTSEGQDHYRLHARHAHTMKDYLAYDVRCPKCSSPLSPSDRPLNYLDLGQYVCRSCRNIKGGK